MELLRTRRATVGAVLLVIAVMFGIGCLSERSAAPAGQDALGKAMSACAEQCRPFGVLQFGLALLPDGSVGLECECMPGEAPSDAAAASEPTPGSTEPPQPIGATPPPERSPTPSGA